MIARMLDGPANGQFMAFERDLETVSVIVFSPPPTSPPLDGPLPPPHEVIYRLVGFAPTGEALFSSEWGTTETSARA